MMDVNKPLTLLEYQNLGRILRESSETLRYGLAYTKHRLEMARSLVRSLQDDLEFYEHRITINNQIMNYWKTFDLDEVICPTAPAEEETPPTEAGAARPETPTDRASTETG